MAPQYAPVKIIVNGEHLTFQNKFSCSGGIVILDPGGADNVLPVPFDIDHSQQLTHGIFDATIHFADKWSEPC